MKLRPYQQEAHDSIIEHFKNHQSTLIVMATGTGKTIVFAHLIKTMHHRRTMVLAHRNELIVQARDKIERVTNFTVDIEKADLYARKGVFSPPVIVSSIQTQVSGPVGNRRYTNFNPEDFGLLICDEAHHTTSPSWRETIDYYKRNPKLKVLGCTATPDRTDEEALGQVFETVAYEYDLKRAIEEGYLVDIAVDYVAVEGLDYSSVRTTAGDLNEGDLSKVLVLERNIHGMCQPTLEIVFALEKKTLSAIEPTKWKEYLAGLNRTPRRTIVFTTSVAQAELHKEVFSRAMDGVEWVCGKTNAQERKDILERFASGVTHIVVNCGVLLEGFDNPAVEVIAMARPTESRALYAQAIGRSTRTLPGIIDNLDTAKERKAAIASSAKPFCRIIDFVGNSGKHKLITAGNILGGHVNDEVVDRAMHNAIKKNKPVMVSTALTEADRQLKKEQEEREERARKEEEERRKRVLAKSHFTTKSVDPFSKNDGFSAGSDQSRDGKSFSQRQAARLRKLGKNPITLLYRAGLAIIAAYFNGPCTEPQAGTLRKYGYDPEKFTVKTASMKIDQIAANGWKRPDPI